MPRYVLLEHDYPVLHWDFMLEAGDVLRTWRLAMSPQPGSCIPAEPLADHRRQYLEYEGPVSGGRGHVTRWDAGSFTWQADEPGRVAVTLEGERLRGSAVLSRDAAGGWSWAFEGVIPKVTPP
jgi:hypothetical protein